MKRVLNAIFLVLTLLLATSCDENNSATIQRKAERGDAVSQFEIGLKYDLGELGNDDEEAVRWYRKAADQGLAEAQCNLGNMYRDGRGSKTRLYI